MKLRLSEIRKFIKEQSEMIDREDRLHSMVLDISKTLDRFTNDAINHGVSKEEYVHIIKELQDSFKGLIRLCLAKVNYLAKPQMNTGSEEVQQQAPIKSPTGDSIPPTA